MGAGKLISIVPIDSELTTQNASEIFNFSRPHVSKLLEEGKINFTKVGKHRWILLEYVIRYRHQMKVEHKKHLIDMMKFAEEVGINM